MTILRCGGRGTFAIDIVVQLGPESVRGQVKENRLPGRIPVGSVVPNLTSLARHAANSVLIHRKLCVEYLRIAEIKAIISAMGAENESLYLQPRGLAQDPLEPRKAGGAFGFRPA